MFHNFELYDGWVKHFHLQSWAHNRIIQVFSIQINNTGNMFQHKASQVSSTKLNNLSRKKDITLFNNALYFDKSFSLYVLCDKSLLSRTIWLLCHLIILGTVIFLYLLSFIRFHDMIKLLIPSHWEGAHTYYHTENDHNLEKKINWKVI